MSHLQFLRFLRQPYAWMRTTAPPRIIILIGLLSLAACFTQPRPTDAAPAPTLGSDFQHTAEPVSTIRELTILYTNDEHGWLDGMEPGQGAANMMGLWRETESYSPETHLVLSGGDMWTGSAVSTWFDGESMTEVMNQMGYTAAAIGNHEFDFGLDALSQRSEQAVFPFVSANLRYQRDGQTPTDLGIQPYIRTTVNGIQVGIVGLTTTRTPIETNPINVSQFDFLDYETSLRQIVPKLRSEGAELILVPAHVCQAELQKLARAIQDLGVHMMGSGHCNELFASQVGDTVIVGGGFHLTSYAFVTLHFDTESDTVIDAHYGVRQNDGGTPDPAVQAVVEKWQAATDAELDLVIGYSARGIQRRSQTMQSLITESWLEAYPTAAVAITNLGGMRAAVPAGNITLARIVDVMPFNNVIIDLRLTGAQLLRVLAFATGDAIGGVRQRGTQWVSNKNGVPIDPDRVYNVLVNDFMYAGGDDYGLLAEFDPDAYNTGINWRQPVIDWIERQASTAVNPIDEAVSRIGQP